VQEPLELSYTVWRQAWGGAERTYDHSEWHVQQRHKTLQQLTTTTQGLGQGC
jgi:hypothetical protein